jgi:hypothetical protein
VRDDRSSIGTHRAVTGDGLQVAAMGNQIVDTTVTGTTCGAFIAADQGAIIID